MNRTIANSLGRQALQAFANPPWRITLAILAGVAVIWALSCTMDSSCACRGTPIGEAILP